MTHRTFIARLDGKVIGKRTSESRIYTHAVIGTPDLARERAYAYDYKGDRTDASNFAYYRSYLDGTSKYLVKDDELALWQTDEQHAAECARRIKNAREALGGAETLEQYIAVLRSREIAAFEAKLAAGRFAPVVLQWSQSATNARKGLTRNWGWFVGLDVIPVEELVKGAAKAS